VNMRVKDAQEILNERNIEFVLNNELSKNVSDEQVVYNQEPSYGSVYNNGTVVKLFISVKNNSNETGYIIPDVRKMSLRKAINKLVSEGFIIDVNGSGEVVDVFPKTGTKVSSNSKVIIFCKEEN